MLKLSVILLLVLQLSQCTFGDKAVDDLLSQMSAEDKCGQMTQVTFDVIQKDNFNLNDDPVDLEKLKTAILDYKVGSILNTPRNTAQKGQIWQTIINHIHDVVKDTNLKIPVIYGIDSIHGANYIQEATLFPQPLSQAATFNTQLVEKIGEVVARETRAVGIPWNFNPVMDIGRQPVWPRLYETFGEDVRLGENLGEAYIKGHQGNDLKNKTKAATCLKHYIGYSYPFNGRDRSIAWIPENLLREYFLPAFASGVAAGAPTVMINSGDVNGMPGHANKHYITDILKGELKFDGFTVSDWEDIVRLYTRDKVAETPEEAVKIAVMAGVDMSMVPYDFSFFNHCVSLHNKSSEFRDRVDDAVKRILMVKQKLGILTHSQNIYPQAADLNVIGNTESDALNLEIAKESIILAKNENKALPLRNDQTILVVGATANLLKVLNGGWSYTWQGDQEQYFQTFSGKNYPTIFDAMKKFPNRNIIYREGANFTHITNIDEAIESAVNSDIIVLCIGEDTYTETPGNIGNMELSESQTYLAERLLETGKQVVVVYVGGRPRIITSIVEKADAVVFAFLPGNRGGDAIASVLFGDYNPNGKLPITYPRGPNGVITYDFRPIENFETSQASNFDAIFAFGHGLSYTEFEYTNLGLNQNEVSSPNPVVTGSVTVKNVGTRPGKETVIVYLNDEYGSLSRPVKQMKYFTKITLQPGESKTINFDFNRYDMSFIDLNNRRIGEPGKFNVIVKSLSASFNLVGSIIILNDPNQPTTTTTPKPPLTTTTTPKPPLTTTTTTTKPPITTSNSIALNNSVFCVLLPLTMIAFSLKKYLLC